jgi:hypothetical protein
MIVLGYLKYSDAPIRLPNGLIWEYKKAWIAWYQDLVSIEKRHYVQQWGIYKLLLMKNDIAEDMLNIPPLLNCDAEKRQERLTLRQSGLPEKLCRPIDETMLRRATF